MPPGQRVRFDMPVALLPTHTQLHLPFTVLNGLRPGPRLWVSAAVHGDELNGVEVIRRLLGRLDEPLRRGALIAVPIVNVFGFIQQSRYLPDRRDLNRSFPGSAQGSLAARIAHLFMTEVVAHSQYGVDLHTASGDRSNQPQVRGDLDDPETLRIARAFAAPVMVHSQVRDGSLRGAAMRRGVPVLVYEGGEAMRFNENAVRVGVQGVLGVMRELGLVRRKPKPANPWRSIRIDESRWVRARRGGLLRLEVKEGQIVGHRARLGAIGDPFGDEEVIVRAPFRGLVIGIAKNPVVHGGDGIVHVGRLGADEG